MGDLESFLMRKFEGLVDSITVEPKEDLDMVSLIIFGFYLFLSSYVIFHHISTTEQPPLWSKEAILTSEFPLHVRLDVGSQATFVSYSVSSKGWWWWGRCVE